MGRQYARDRAAFATVPNYDKPEAEVVTADATVVGTESAFKLASSWPHSSKNGIKVFLSAHMLADLIHSAR
jgi:hypothetical protein